MSSQYPSLEWLSLRSDGDSPALIAHRAGVPVAAVTRATDPYGPFPRPTHQLGRVVAPEDVVDRRVARWVQLRRDGMRVTEIAAQEGVVHQIVSKSTLPFGPYPEPHPPHDTIQRWVSERRVGIPATVIASVAGVSVDLVASEHAAPRSVSRRRQPNTLRMGRRQRSCEPRRRLTPNHPQVDRHRLHAAR